MAGNPVRTRSGVKARIIAFDREDPYFPIVALLKIQEGFEIIHVYTSDGRYVRNAIRGHDLVMVD